MNRKIFMILSIVFLSVTIISAMLIESLITIDEMNGGEPHGINTSYNTTYNVSIPRDTPKINTYELTNPDVSQQYCSILINNTYNRWIDNKTRIKNTNDSIIYLKDNETIDINKMSGRLDYSNISAFFKWNDYQNKYLLNPQNIELNISNVDKINSLINSSVAYNISIEYMRTHGGLPQNMFLYQNRTINVKCYSLNISYPSNYLFRFQRTIDSHPILGGEGVVLTISPLGDILSYYLLWRNVINSSKSITVISALDSANYLNKHITKNITVEKIEIGYYSNQDDETQYQLSPVWIFYTNKEYDLCTCVDAVNSNIIYG